MLIWFQQHKAEFIDLTTMKNMFLARYNPWGKTKRDQLKSWNNMSFDLQKTDNDEQIDLVLTLGNMLKQDEKAKMDKFIETMPTIIQTHLIIAPNWEEVTKKAKNLEHIIHRCEPLAIALLISQDTGAFPGLHSHIEQSQDQDSASIPKPFKSARGHRGKKSKGKVKQQQQPQPPSPPTEQEEHYEDGNNYYHNENYRGNNRGCRSYRGQYNNKRPYRGSQQRGRGQQNNYRGQFQGNQGQFNPSHGSYNNNYYGNYHGRGGHGCSGNFHRPHGHRRGKYRDNNNYQYHQYYTCDDGTQFEQYGPLCTLCGSFNHSPKHCFMGEHYINNLMEKMSLGSNSQHQNGLY